MVTQKQIQTNIKDRSSEHGGEQRYTPGMAYRQGLTRNPDYGWESGPEGVDQKSLEMDWQMPRRLVELGEGVIMEIQEILVPG